MFARVCVCALTAVVEEAHVGQNKPPLLPQLHARAILQGSKVTDHQSVSQSLAFTENNTPSHTHTHRLFLLF